MKKRPNKKASRNKKLSKRKAAQPLAKQPKAPKPKTLQKAVMDDSQIQTQSTQEVARLKSSLDLAHEQLIQKEKEGNERVQENQRLQIQIQSLQAAQELFTQKDREWQDKFSIEAARAKQIESDKNTLNKKLKSERKEKKIYLAEIRALEEKLQSSKLTIENLLNQKQDLETKLHDQKHQVALEWAQGLGEILTKLSALAEKEPEPVLGLKPRAVYETLLSWLEKAFGERPKMFPSSREFTTTSDGKYLITLDADIDGIEVLLRRYDWSYEHPFESKPEGQRQCHFKVMQWGWKVNDTILVRAKVTSCNPEQ